MRPQTKWQTVKKKQKAMTLKEAINILTEAGVDSPLYDSRELFKIYCPEPIMMNTVCDDAQLLSAIERRKNREPLQYIIGEVGFYREEYFISPACLIPRADTEILVDYAVKNLPRGAHFADLCTGSGCVAISVLKNTAETTAIAMDISTDALEVARKNAERNKVSERIEFLEADVLKADAPTTDAEPIFAMLSNPPYVSDDAYASLEKEIYHEPKIAFVAGSDGGDFYRLLTKKYKNVIDKFGFIAYEIGYDQADMLKKIAEENNMSCEIIKDLSGNDRVAVLKNLNV